MAKKTQSKPMGEIVKRIKMFDFVEVEIFDENQILNDPVEKWPLCDCLISFHSKVEINSKNLKQNLKINPTKIIIIQGFPLEKAIEYENLRKPFVINDLEKQWDIQDRVKVYQTLTDNGIETPR